MIAMDRLTVESTADITLARRQVGAAAASVLDERRAPDVQLVVSELITNALEHGAGPPVAVEVEGTFDGLTVAVASRSADVPVPPIGPAPVSQLCGRGLQIVSTLSDHVLVTGADGRLCVTVRFDRQ